MSLPVPLVCSRCAHPNDAVALTCSACGAYLLVDLRVEEPITDPRLRYHAAKAIAAKGRPFPDISRAGRDLQTRGSILVAGMSGAAAAASIEALAALGVRARVTPSPAASAAPPGPASPPGVPPPHDPAASPGRAAPAFEAYLPSGRKLGRLSPGMIVSLLVALAVVYGILRALLGQPHATTAPVPAASFRPVPTQADSSSTARTPPAAPPTRELVTRALESAAMLSCGQSAGSGFFVAPELLVTNHHVTCGSGETIQVTMRSHRTLTGSIFRSDPWLDLAVIRVPGAGAPALPLGDSTTLAPGDRVLAVGNPIGLGFSVNQGMISHTERELLGIGYVQFDGNINPGNSGGPLVDLDGNVVGIVSMMVRDSRGLSFAIPVNYLYEGSRPFLEVPTAPALKGHEDRWRQFLARIRVEEDREISALGSAFRRPGLAAAAMDPRGIAAVVVRRNGMEPAPERMYFRLSEEGRQLCNPTGLVEGWRRMDAGAKDEMGDGRYIEWMQKHGLAAEIWVGITRMSWSGCPAPTSSSSLELILEGADPHADRVMLRKSGS